MLMIIRASGINLKDLGIAGPNYKNYNLQSLAIYVNGGYKYIGTNCCVTSLYLSLYYLSIVLVNKLIF